MKKGMRKYLNNDGGGGEGSEAVFYARTRIIGFFRVNSRKFL